MLVEKTHFDHHCFNRSLRNQHASYSLTTSIIIVYVELESYGEVLSLLFEAKKGKFAKCSSHVTYLWQERCQ